MSSVALEINAAPPATVPLCDACRRPATVFVRCDALFFSGPRCNDCAPAVRTWAASRNEVASYSALAGVPRVTTIDGIDLAALVVAVLDCAVGDHDVRDVQRVPDAVNAVAAVLVGKLRRSLTALEEVSVIEVTANEVTRRWKEKRAGLLAVQRDLHRPMFVMTGGR